MKSVHLLTRLLALAFCLSINTARGAVFNFSYTFGDGLAASGYLTGTQAGLFVDNVSDVSLSFNGTAVPGSLFASRYDPSTLSYLSGPVVSFDALQNNFVFSNSNFAAGDFAADSLFYLLDASASGFGEANAVGMAFPLGHFGSQDLPVVPRSWTLTSAATVPDSGATVTLLGMAMIGLAWRRRRR